MSLFTKSVLFFSVRETEAPAKSTYVHTAANQYFQGTKRSSSPFG